MVWRCGETIRFSREGEKSIIKGHILVGYISIKVWYGAIYSDAGLYHGNFDRGKEFERFE